ncbi:M23 family metallopeptidase [Cyclobacterium plantarum]|uniref:M23 family metallopeptidase n=1 Tax=Cyclobacterium plantarum TaxID=2716263 RepID=A0ABX0H0C0_9BACT|nr:M23 family metallopeptidase [Cyclobacterium plantarum]NHE55230.1 M23 family metallopeptidase [Cyclobacterium plantarum]
MSLKQKINDWIETKFLIVIRKEEDFSVITSFNITKIRVGLLFVLVFMACFVAALFLSKSLLARWFDPVYIETENMVKIHSLSETIDSLIMEVEAKDQYVRNIQMVISGEEEMDQVETASNEDTAEREQVNRSEIDLFKSSEATQKIVREFESLPLEEANFGRISSGSFTDNYFFPPVKGVVTSGYSSAEAHFGVDVVAGEDEPVKAVADGTVIFANWTLETGYVVGVQHSNELISIYKHNSVILKSVGDPIRGGEILSIIGNTGEQTTGQHLHLELWYKGNPLDPQEFITFD